MDLFQIHTEDVLGLCTDEFEGQGQTSKVKVTRDKKRHFWSFWRPAGGLRLEKHL